ncbi:MAG: hypothetical protein ACOCVI_02070 [Planctomycetota bacterium]
MKNTQNVTILLLTISAILLGALLVGLNHTDRAQGAMAQRRNEYIQVTGQYNSSTELLYVVDLTQQKMNVYFADEKKKATTLLTQLDLKRAFQE